MRWLIIASTRAIPQYLSTFLFLEDKLCCLRLSSRRNVRRNMEEPYSRIVAHTQRVRSLLTCDLMRHQSHDLNNCLALKQQGAREKSYAMAKKKGYIKRKLFVVRNQLPP